MQTYKPTLLFVYSHLHVSSVYINTDTQPNTFKQMEYPLAQVILFLELNGRK